MSEDDWEAYEEGEEQEIDELLEVEVNNDTNERRLNIMEQKNKTLKQEALDYEPAVKTKNISELASVSTTLITEDDSFSFIEKDGKEKTVNQKVVLINGEKYRVPLSVIGSLKVILEDNPNLKIFKVKKTGEGKDGTKYTVIPLG